MEAHFNLNDIRELCFDLRIDYEELGEGLAKSTRILNLIQHSVKTNRFHNLVANIQQRRPHVKWPGIKHAHSLSLRDTFPLPPPFEWIYIPKGSVSVQSLPHQQENHGTKKTEFVSEFAISKYPVTHSQYEVFIQHPNGYLNDAWWRFSDAALGWHLHNAHPPRSKFTGPDIPKTNVSWYEAVAFCMWLSHEVGQSISLPSDEQWQRAAVGDTSYKYPWGNETRKGRCNYGSSEPLPVDYFPRSQSPYGVAAMSGHVWEWCISEWETGFNTLENSLSDSRRSLRGGSWKQIDQRFFRCDFREAAHPPSARGDTAGFRPILALQ